VVEMVSKEVHLRQIRETMADEDRQIDMVAQPIRIIKMFMHIDSSSMSTLMRI